ncbi:signal transduction histidine kinase [Thermocatellispora tengchongensis]|uniref:Signal transduction histidine kinase n=1 Tax=Thermocatellispora tengchongensis TaxID=1073253 RepID=A0A840P2Q9_9ACTN|nr:sensor histidine kinase [Thermocatellispora tengchongensis]MBB5132786.1 signal transduction histidine kinase [Thermocatellispora tengchongensis]
MRAVSGAVAALAVTLTVTGTILQFRVPAEWAPWPPVAPDHGAGLTFPVVGAFLLAHRPRLRMGWLMCGGGLACAVNVMATGLLVHHASAGDLETAGYMRLAAALGWQLGGATLAVLLPLLSPDDRLPSRRWRVVVVVGVLATLAEGTRILVRPTPPAASYMWPQVIPNPLAIESLAPYNATIMTVTTVAINVCVVLALLSLGLRLRRADPLGRRQIGWPLATFAIYVVFLILGEDFWLPATIWTGLIPVAIAFAVLRYRLYGIDTVISRAVVATGLIFAIGAVYFGVGALGGLLVSGYDELAGLAAALAAGAFFQPLRVRLRRLADVMLYGKHGEPRELARRLAREVRETEPTNALAAVTAVVRDGLGVTGVAVEVGRAGIRVELGRAGPDPREVPLIWHGEPVGRMLLGPPGPRRFAAAYNDRLIAAATPYVSDVAHAVLMAADLQRSRERILSAREEERRRLRRDLHDGLGQALTNMSMSLNMARLTLRKAPSSADRLLLDLRTGMDSVSQEIRELVYGLRPPSLDDLGLAGAIRALADEPGPPVSVEVEGEMTELPAAVEVAAYRIAQEALTNVRKHSGASRATVSLTRTPHALVVRVRDDGKGLPEHRRSGVGFASMRERAAELGGTCLITSDSGTQVEATLPLPG